MVSQSDPYYINSNFLVTPSWQNERQLLSEAQAAPGVYVMNTDHSHKLHDATSDGLPQPQQVLMTIKSENTNDIKPHPIGVTVATISDGMDGQSEVKTPSNSGLLTPTNTSVISHTSQDSPDLDSSKVKYFFSFFFAVVSRKIVATAAQ